MEIKTTKRCDGCDYEVKCSTSKIRDNNYCPFCNKSMNIIKWVKVSDIIKDCNMKIRIVGSTGSDEYNLGYIDCLKCIIDELSQSNPKVNIIHNKNCNCFNCVNKSSF